jgi:hypothetical protein
MHIPSHPIISYLCSIAPHLSTRAKAMDYGDRRSGADYLGRLRSGLRASTLVWSNRSSHAFTRNLRSTQ